MQKQAEIELEHKILNEASRALGDEALFTAELRDHRIQYENEYRQYIAQQRKEEVKIQILVLTKISIFDQDFGFDRMFDF